MQKNAPNKTKHDTGKQRKLVQTMGEKKEEWMELQSNVSSHCSRLQWGGINEVQIWAMIINQEVVVLDSNTDKATIFHPKGNELPKTVNLEDMNKRHNTGLRQNKKAQYILYNGRDHYNGITTCNTVNYKPPKTVNNSNMNKNSKFKLRRRIKQNRNRRTKNSKLISDENEERFKRHNEYAAETVRINTSEHRARPARSVIHNPESSRDAEIEDTITTDKLAQINEQINDISAEKEKREKRKINKKMTIRIIKKGK